MPPVKKPAEPREPPVVGRATPLTESKRDEPMPMFLDLAVTYLGLALIALGLCLIYRES